MSTTHKVTMTEEVTIHFEIEVEADTPEQAHRKAHNRLVECNQDEPSEECVNSRIFEISSNGELREFNDGHFED